MACCSVGEVRAPDTDARRQGIREGAEGRKGDIRGHEDTEACMPRALYTVSLNVGVARRRSRILLPRRASTA